MGRFRWTTPLAVAALALLPQACVGEGYESASVTLLSSNGQFEGSFSPEPDPPRTGGTVYEVQLSVAATGAPVEGAALVVAPWMPAHGHGTMIAPEVEELGDGVYRVTIFYTMAGVWETTVEVDDGNSQDEFVVTQEVVG